MSHISLLNHTKLASFQFFLWPVFPHERKLVLFLSSLIFLVWSTIVLIYPFHDGILLMAPNSGAEVLGYLRIFGLLPAGITFITIYCWLYNKFYKPKTVEILYIFFVLFYLVYAFYIFPNNASLRIDPSTISYLMTQYPAIKWIFPLYGNWAITLFYIISITWTIAAPSQLFWQTANHFTQTDQASRFYPLFIIFAALATIIAAGAIALLNSYLDTLGVQSQTEKTSLVFQIVSIVNIFLSGLLIFLFKKIYLIFPLASGVHKKKKTIPSSALTGFSYLFRSSYLRYIFVTLISSMVIYELINVLWKSELKAFLITPYAYDLFLNRYTLWGGIVSIILALGTKSFIYRWGWSSAALMAPLISLLSTIPFFIVILIHRVTGHAVRIFNVDPHYLLSILGSFQNITMSAALTCLYYPTKEMTYIPLNKDMKTKGKAATDILGEQCGQAGSGLLQEGLLWSGGSDLAIVPQLMTLIGGFFVGWVLATKALGKRYLVRLQSSQIKP